MTQAGIIFLTEGAEQDVADILRASGYAVERQETAPLERAAIADTLRRWSAEGCDLIVTVGGAGIAARDITPEATRDVIERDAPGLIEFLRQSLLARYPEAVWWRGAAGVRGPALLVNLPAGPALVRHALAVLLPLLAQQGKREDRDQDEGRSAHDEALLVSQASGSGHQPSTITILETNLDDFAPELFEVVMERLFAAGALDVFFTPIQMKKNRPATLLSVIAPPEKREELAGVIFRETSAFGIRYAQRERFTLERRWETVETPYGAIRVKIGNWQGEEMSASPEYEDVKAAARLHAIPAKTVYQAAQHAYRLRAAPERQTLP